jgi:hypothetical protein
MGYLAVCNGDFLASARSIAAGLADHRALDFFLLGAGLAGADLT